MKRGRKAQKSKLVEELDGSRYAKDRVRAILDTITGDLSIEEAAERLGMGQSSLYRLRRDALQDLLERFEPKAPGRPGKKKLPEEARVEQMTAAIEGLRKERQTQERREGALIELIEAQRKRNILDSMGLPPRSRRG